MLEQHVALRDHMAQLDDVNLDEFVLYLFCEKRIDALLKKLDEVSQVVL